MKFGFERREEKERNALQVASPWVFEIIAVKMGFQYLSIQLSLKFGFERRKEKELNSSQVASPLVFEIIAFTVWMRVLIR